MFKSFQSYKDFLVYCTETSESLLSVCNDFLKIRNTNKKLYIKHNSKIYKVYLIEKNRYSTTKTLIYKTKKSNQLLKFIEILYKLLVG